MKTKVFLSSIAIATLLGTVWSCSSDVEDYESSTPVKRALSKQYSPEVLAKAHELGITVENDYFHRNELTEERKIYYLDLLALHGDSIFHRVYSTKSLPLRRFVQLKAGTKEESGSTLHEGSYSWDVSRSDYSFYVKIDWKINAKGKPYDPTMVYNVTLRTGYSYEWEEGNASVSVTDGNITYNVVGYIKFKVAGKEKKIEVKEGDTIKV